MRNVYYCCHAIHALTNTHRHTCQTTDKIYSESLDLSFFSLSICQLDECEDGMILLSLVFNSIPIHLIGQIFGVLASPQFILFYFIPFNSVLFFSVRLSLSLSLCVAGFLSLFNNGCITIFTLV